MKTMDKMLDHFLESRKKQKEFLMSLPEEERKKEMEKIIDQNISMKLGSSNLLSCISVNDVKFIDDSKASNIVFSTLDTEITMKLHDVYLKLDILTALREFDFSNKEDQQQIFGDNLLRLTLKHIDTTLPRHLMLEVGWVHVGGGRLVRKEILFSEDILKQVAEEVFYFIKDIRRGVFG